jgi:hypothetical protein
MDLQKQVEEPGAGNEAELSALKKTIDMMQGLYLVLFITSLVVLVINWQGHQPSYMHLLWAGALGGAVITRLVRQSKVAKYNSLLLGGRPGPLT